MTRDAQDVTYRSGRHFLQLPGPTAVPDRVLRAMSSPIIDHRGPEFSNLTRHLFAEMRGVFGGADHVFMVPSSASGCWEMALVNAVPRGSRVLLYENGFFAEKWGRFARTLGYEVDVISEDWRYPVDPDRLEARLAADEPHNIRAVLVVHNETSTGVTSDVAAIRKAIDAAAHPALLMIDTVSSLCAVPFRQAEWGVDVAVCGSQKGLMLPPGLGFCAVSEKALAIHEQVETSAPYFDWTSMLAENKKGFFPYTPPTSLLFGLECALEMLREEGREVTYARHARLAEATRRAVAGWGLDLYSAVPKAASNAGTTVQMPEGTDADQLRTTVLERYDMALGTGLGPLKGRVFRIGHLGDMNEITLLGALAGIEMGLGLCAVPHRREGCRQAIDWLGSP